MSKKCYVKLQIILQADPFTAAGLDNYFNCEVRRCSFEVNTSPTTDRLLLRIHKEQNQQH
jgi:hypothetical protein